jgi:integrase
MLVGYPEREEWLKSYNEPETVKLLKSSLKKFDEFLAEIKPGIELRKAEIEFFDYVRKTDEMELFRIIEKIKNKLLSCISQISARFYLGHIITWFRINGVKIDREEYKLKIRWNKVHKEIKYTPGKDEIRSVVDNSNKLEYKLFYTMAVCTAGRQSEILGLRKMDIDLNNEIPSVHFLAENTKTKQERYSFLTPECADLLKKYYLSEDIQPGDLIFKFCKTSLQKHFQRIRARIGITSKYSTGTAKFSIHRFRAYTKRSLSKNTSGDDFAHLILGHSGGLATYDGDSIEALREEYSQAIPDLTISHEYFKEKKYQDLSFQNKLLLQEIELLKQKIEHDEAPHTHNHHTIPHTQITQN